MPAGNGNLMNPTDTGENSRGLLGRVVFKYTLNHFDYPHLRETKSVFILMFRHTNLSATFQFQKDYLMRLMNDD